MKNKFKITLAILIAAFIAFSKIFGSWATINSFIIFAIIAICVYFIAFKLIDNFVTE